MDGWVGGWVCGWVGGCARARARARACVFVNTGLCGYGIRMLVVVHLCMECTFDLHLSVEGDGVIMIIS